MLRPARVQDILAERLMKAAGLKKGGCGGYEAYYDVENDSVMPYDEKE